MESQRRKVRYGVAMSLDGYIAGPDGEYDWIAQDPEVDASLAEAWSRFEHARPMLTRENLGHRTVVVASRTLPPEGGITVVRNLDRTEMTRLREQGGKDIWMFGGGELFRHLLAIGEIHGGDLGVIAVLLGGGVRLLPPIEQRTELKLTSHRVYGSGIVMLSYDVRR